MDSSLDTDFEPSIIQLLFFPVVNENMLVLYNITLIVQNNLKYLAFVAQTFLMK